MSSAYKQNAEHTKSVYPVGHKEMSSIYWPTNAGEGGVAGSQPMNTAVRNTHGSQNKFGDLTPYLIHRVYVVYLSLL